MKKKNSGLKELMKKYARFREDSVEGRYLSFSHIQLLIQKNGENFRVKEIGRSVNGVPIHSITFGEGKIKILAWSQMHGNESTTTKAVFDLIKAFEQFPDDPVIKSIRNNITIKIIPTLNPDGAMNYTRENANGIDLNRDASRLREPESKLLRSTFMDFDPDFCFNLHDQRTIFSAGPFPYPATLSFLTPAMDEKRKIYPERTISMQVISAMVADLQFWLPNQIGRYSDEFNPNCTGDTFQSLGKPTILFEAGHFPEDYLRETSRKFVATALFSALMNIASENWKNHDQQEYLNIPENKKMYYDIILRNGRVKDEIVDVAIQYKEVLENEEISFQPYIEKIEKTLSYYGHREIECHNLPLTIDANKIPSENVLVKNLYLNNEVLAINYQNI